MTREYDPDSLATDLEELQPGDRVELVWQRGLSGVLEDATGEVVSEPDWNVRVERDRRDDVIAHELSDGKIRVSTIYDGARTSAGELVDVRVQGAADQDDDQDVDDRDGADHVAADGAGENDQDDEPPVEELEVLVDVADELGLDPDDVEAPLERAGVFEKIGSDQDAENAESVVVSDAPTDEPDRPDDLAAYLLDAVDRQGADALRDVAEYALERAAYLEQDLDTSEVELDDGEELVDVKESSSGSGTIVEKKIPCGKDCSGCPHGPYKYLNKRVNGEVKTEYLGKVDS